MLRKLLTIVVISLTLLAGCDSGDNGAADHPNGSTPTTKERGAPTNLDPAVIEKLNKVLANLKSAQAAPVGATGPQFTGSANATTMEEFMTRVITEVDAFWSNVFTRAGRQAEFHTTNYNWFYGQVDAGRCGVATESQGAFYCASPDLADMVYVPVNWMVEEIYKPTNNGDFAVASVIAHEYGHHIQHLLNISTFEAPFHCCGLSSIHVELDADCLAGVWANSAYNQGELDETDLGEALTSASNAGDRVGTEPLAPGAHGQADQRVAYFQYGYDTGDAQACDLAAFRTQ